ncbi:potassium-transporting ATPase subunit C [[Pantoea] beijingensis]|uniref:Potassium-transporting ATPase KdpC subunit n=1 Tax=[Pantoea] beijingensis TaxID=1324864 RepID=A0A443IAF8_9GAMM|nr:MULTISPECIES: potassium-transporting ATPase subunit KdpC [Erwiniaceae]RWR01122.1 potassium-transporting ATPase subunit C [[Pantoea] beijingensis]
MAVLRPALFTFIVLTLITGAVYPLLVTGIAQTLFPQQANGSLLVIDGQLRGSQLIGQPFSAAGDFQGRPSATADAPYNTLASGGSNLAASNPALDNAVAARIAALRAANSQASQTVPVELVTASGSGLDPDLSPTAALWQAPRIADARGIPLAEVKQLIRDHTHQPLLKFTGEPTVNVLMLNLALDNLSTEDNK